MIPPSSFSSRLARASGSPISYLMEQGVSRPDLISLAAGLVDQDSLPVEETREAVLEVLRTPVSGREALQYGTTHGHLGLRRRWRDDLLKADGIDNAIPDERVLVGTGSQQLLYLLAEVLIDPGDIVLAGVPTYFVYSGALASFGTQIIPVETDENGPMPESLERELGRLSHAGLLSRVKFVYGVTYFNNPTGLSWNLDRRKEIVSIVKHWSKTHRIYIVEDAAYRELRYAGRDVPSLLGLDPEGETVIYTSTFSKPFAPGIRTGCMTAPEELIGPLVELKGHHDFGSSNFNQRISLQLLESGGYARHLDVLRTVYARKLSAMLDTLQEGLGNLGSQVTWTKPEGGLYVWVTLPPDIKTGLESDLFTRTLDAGVLYVPGEFCFPIGMQNAPCSTIRLSYGHPSLERCREGMKRFTRVVRETLS